MYKVLKINKKDGSYELLVKGKRCKKPLWLIASMIPDDIMFDWKEKDFNFKNKHDIIRMLVQNNSEEFIDACASSLCYLEKKNLIKVNDDGTVSEVTHESNN